MWGVVLLLSSERKCVLYRFVLQLSVHFSSFTIKGFQDVWYTWYMIYLSTAIGLTPDGSTHLHTNNTQNDTINNKTIWITNKTTQTTNLEECWPCPVFVSFYPGICHTTEGKAQKNLSQGSRRDSKYTHYQDTHTLSGHPHIIRAPTLYKAQSL
jgi:hypothetical protein